MQEHRMKHPVSFYEECAKYLNEGHSLKDTAEKFNVNYCTLKQNLTRLGLRKPSRVGNKNKIISFNDHYFDVIDSHNKAYFLGWMMSDGYIAKTSYGYSAGIALQSCDKYILEAFKKETSHTVKITHYKNSDKLVFNGGDSFIKALRSYGICENKSHSEYGLPKIPEEYFSSFVRGYFDGDGCITIKATGYSVTSICGNSEQFLTELQQKLEKDYNILNIRVNKEEKNRKNPLYVMYISRKDNQNQFKEFIYQNAEIKLERKYDKFMQIPC